MQLPAGEQRRATNEPRDALAGPRNGPCERDRHSRRYRPASSHTHDALSQFPKRHVDVTEDVAFPRRPAISRQQLTLRQPRREHQTGAARRQHRKLQSLPENHRLEQVLFERTCRSAGAGAVDRRGIDDHKLNTNLVCGERRQLLGILLGALVSSRFGSGRDARFVECATRRGLEYIDRTRVHHAAHARSSSRPDDRLGSASIDPLKRAFVSKPLLGQSHRVEDHLAASARMLERRTLRDIAPDEIDPLRKNTPGAVMIPDQRTHRISTFQQGQNQTVTDLPGGPGDKCLHERSLTRTYRSELPLGGLRAPAGR